MNCEKISTYLSDYLQDELGWTTRIKVAVHLKKCSQCRTLADSLQNAMNVLQADILPEPSSEIWEEIPKNVMSATKYMPLAILKRNRIYRAAAATLLLVILSFAGLMIASPSGQKEDKNSHLFWTFFNSDLWDFSKFFGQMNEKKLAQLTPKIEQRLKIKLKQELQLDHKDETKLFPLLQTFSQKMKEYWYSYGSALSDLSKVVEKNESGNLDAILQRVHAIRQSWTNCRWRLLEDVKIVLDRKQFARFLIFTERIPQELYIICQDVCNNG